MSPDVMDAFLRFMEEDARRQRREAAKAKAKG